MDVPALVEGIRRYTIHGEPYTVVYYSRDSDRDNIHQAQLSDDAIPTGLRVGDPIVITMVGTVVAGIRRG